MLALLLAIVFVVILVQLLAPGLLNNYYND